MKWAVPWLSGILVASGFFGWSISQGFCVEPIRTLEQCARIQNSAERLACYDRLAQRETGETVVSQFSSASVEQVVAELPSENNEDVSQASFLTRLWDLDESQSRGNFAFMAHRDNYILPLAYNTSPNRKPGHTGEVSTVDEAEAAFQLSIKIKLWQDVLGQNLDLWFGYTQRSFWQVYAVDDSSPFRDTNYEPEILFNYRTDYNFLGGKLRTLTLGLNHQSNGRAEPLSRSWNRLVAHLGWERGPLVVQVAAWYRIPEAEEDDDNPDIHRFMGPGEIRVHYDLGNHRLGAMLRNNCRFHDNRGALQLDWIFPIGHSRFKGYLQYFTGYGESLLDYDHAVNRIGLGVILSRW